MDLPLVEVLLATYNGERYLPEQIDSILAQQDVEVRLVVHDDGSTDGTRRVLERYRADPRVHLRDGPRLGLPDVYFSLIQGSSPHARAWALADQDDVWLPDKLARAMASLARDPGPMLYCSRVMVTDDRLGELGAHPLPRRGPSFTNALVQNIATGCTIVLNAGARGVLLDRWPTGAVMHDAWLYLVVSGTGTVVYDPAVTVLYRQHAANAVGMGRGRLARFAGRLRRQLAGGSGAHGRQDAELARTHADLLRPDARRELDALLRARRSRWHRLGYAARGAAHRQTLGSDLVLRSLILTGRV